MIKVQQEEFELPRIVNRPPCPAGAYAVAAALLLGSVLVGCSARVEGVETNDGRVQLTVERSLMETHFRIDVVVADEAHGRNAIEAAFSEIVRSEEVLSNWSETSQITEVNRAAGSAPVVVSHELMAVLTRALDISVLTDGAFDVTFASCGGLWSVRNHRVPSNAEIAACLGHVDYRKVALDHQISAIYVSDPAMRIGVAGLAKGYRVDRAADILKNHGIVDFVVDGGGDMRLSTAAESPPWQIDVAHPRRPDQPLGSLALSSGAIATSGDYQWYFERDGVRYHHILDPASGRPARRSVSATVIAETTTEADALATGLFVMGPARGISLAEELAGVEALLIAPDLSVHVTSGFPEMAPTGVTS